MNLDDYVSASEASRLLGVTRQRISTMVKDGDLPAVHPWPGAVRIHRSTVDAWLRGERPPAVHRTAARHYVLREADVMTMDSLGLREVRALCTAFITERRPYWSPEQAATWAAQMAESLTSRS